eukprot:CCRYP_014442-RB/>CCRYP_014442-RB protein AED:0.00 eAED:0.00 QI:131/1/1/1/0.66/0.5/4/972/1336
MHFSAQPPQGNGDMAQLDGVSTASKKTRACTACHRAKSKCVFSEEGELKCDRCLRLNKECVPHVSRQGQRKKKSEKGMMKSSVATSLGEVSKGSNVTNQDPMFGESKSTSPFGPDNAVEGKRPFSFHAASHDTPLNRFAATATGGPSMSQMAPLAKFIPQKHMFSSNHPTFHDAGACGLDETRLRSNQAGTALPADQTNITVTEQRQATMARFSDNNRTITDSIQQGVAFREVLSSSMSMPLREWMKCALDSNEIRDSSGSSPISPKYIASCLKIALSLSKQISDAEVTSSREILQWLPRHIINWPQYITVKLKGNETQVPCHDARIGPLDDSSAAEDELDRLEALLDSICEEDEVDTTDVFDIDSAEILLDYSKSSDDGVGSLACCEQEDRIHALGLVFSELFSGGRVPSTEQVSDEFSQVNVVTPAVSERLDFTGMLKLEPNEKDIYDDTSCKYAGTRKKTRELDESLHSSIESLRRLGISCPLCDLIFNMLDSINGDLGRDDSYRKMSDVAIDLQNMVDKPKTFLNDLDVITLSSTGLQLTDNLFMRDEEAALLQHAYYRSTLGSSEFAVITGGSGTGKSHLAFRLGSHITSHGGVFLSVKFNQMKQADPYSALVSAFNEYFNNFTTTNQSDSMKLIASKLRDALGQDALLLAKVIPNLAEVLDFGAIDAAFDRDCVNGHEKMHYILVCFVEVISACSHVTLTLFLDDLQWADAFSLSVLQQIMIMPDEHKRFFFVGCYRDDQMEDDHPFKKMISRCGDFGVRLTMVYLECMDKDGMNTMISELLCLPRRLVKSLSELVYSKTKGNPLFLSRLLISLNKDGLLNLSLGRRRWVWDEKQIQSKELPDDVASFFSSRVGKLSPEVQAALQVLSCFGSVNTYELSILESGLSLNVVKPLERAVNEGFVSKNGNDYRFSHDKIHEAVYGMVELEARRFQHLNYAISLVKFALGQDDSIIFTAVGQANLASPSITTDALQSAEFARCNMVAGKKAMSLSDFSCAAICFSKGLSFLDENRWSDYYNLSLELFELAAKCALVLGDFASLATMSEQVEKHSRCFEDKLEVSFLVMCSLAYASKISDSVHIGLSILSQLGHALPTNFTRAEIIFHIQQTKTVLHSISDKDLMFYKKMTDPKHIMAMRCLAKLELIVLQINPDLQPIITLKMVNMTMDLGVSHMSSVGMAYFAGLVAKLDEIQDGIRFARLAKMLLDKSGSKEITGDVIFTTSEVLCFHEPLQSVNEYRFYGQSSALAAGDMYFACVLKMSNCGTMLWMGSNLLSVKDAFVQVARYLKAKNHLSTYNLLLLSKHSILMLMGQADEDEPLTVDQLTNPYQLKYL